jgi:hypothetical protein
MDQSFKIQPVAAFYRLLAKCFPLILAVSVLGATILFVLLKSIVSGVLGKNGKAELLQLIEAQSSGSVDYMEQTKQMQKFLTAYPTVMPVFLVLLCLGLLISAYIIFNTHQFIRQKTFEVQMNWKTVFLPNKTFFSTAVFILLILGLLILLSGLIFVLISTNPILGSIVLLMLFMVLIRHILVIPSIILGELDMSEAIKYSRELITTGKAFKIIVFGGLLFFALSFLMSLLFYFPSRWINTPETKIYLNFLLSLLQIGFVSVGMASLFLRYGEFEEIKIAE